MILKQDVLDLAISLERARSRSLGLLMELGASAVGQLTVEVLRGRDLVAKDSGFAALAEIATRRRRHKLGSATHTAFGRTLSAHAADILSSQRSIDVSRGLDCRSGLVAGAQKRSARRWTHSARAPRRRRWPTPPPFILQTRPN